LKFGNPNTHNTSKEQKTAANILMHVLTDIQIMEEHFGATMIVWSSDTAGDAHKMRKDLVKAQPWMISLDFWAHQCNLVMGDIFKAKVGLPTTIEQATKIIKGFNNHSHALSILHHEKIVTYQKALVTKYSELWNQNTNSRISETWRS
ncbi:hypothetical protein PAXRUDRAFT_164672, partial [Paxillus rubicundulus Ve08.2h10]